MIVIRQCVIAAKNDPNGTFGLILEAGNVESG